MTMTVYTAIRSLDESRTTYIAGKDDAEQGVRGYIRRQQRYARSYT